jgi:NADPH-dependent 2,4-dienoyl-CoA reductase/sulfur reductase-like enzyme
VVNPERAPNPGTVMNHETAANPETEEQPVKNIVVVGASLAGTRAVQSLRAQGYRGRIVVLTEEPEAFYDRPPLSKQFLRGEFGRADIDLVETAEYDALGVELRVGSRAVSLDLACQRVALADGSEVAYDGLVVATGARARTLPGVRPGHRVHVLRTLADAARLRAALGPGVRLGILGGGFVGTEVASSAVALGCRVTVIEQAPAPMAPVLGISLAENLARAARAAGVEIAAAQRAAEVRAGAEGCPLVELESGVTLEFDQLLVSVGAVPNAEWLAGSGLEVDGGLVCDGSLFAAGTARPGSVVGAGDVVRLREPDGSLAPRVEHWTHAAAQGELAAANLLTDPADAPRFRAVPYVWSDQFGYRIEILGQLAQGDSPEQIWSVPGEVSSLYVCRREGRPTALIGVNAMRWLVDARRRLRGKAELTDEALAHLTRRLEAAS